MFFLKALKKQNDMLIGHALSNFYFLIFIKKKQILRVFKSI